MILCIRLSFSLDGDQLDRSSFIECEVWEVDEFISNSWRRDCCGFKKTFLNVNLCFLFDGCWFYFFPEGAQPIPPPAPGAQREQLQTGLPRNLTQVSTVRHNAFATSLKSQISILARAAWKLGTPLEGAATRLASITTKHYYNNKIKYLIIFRVIDSEVTKSGEQFGMCSFKKMLLIFHPTWWIDLHYWNLNSPDDEWIKFHPKQSSFVALILNYLYELTLTLILNAKNRN